MKKDLDINESRDFFLIKKIEDIIVIRLRGNLLQMATDLNASNKLLDYLDQIEKNESIKVIVILAPSEKIGRQELIEFYHHIFTLKMGIDAIHRMFNVVDQVLLKLLELDKMVIHANSGKVISLFLNISLACDYRIVADNTLFQNPYIKLGTVPKGGGAFFLPKLLGTKKAFEILLSGRDISASEALNLGIVDQVVPFSRLEESTLKIAHDFCKKPASSLTGIKKLLNYNLKDLREYLEIENQVLLKIIKTPDLKSDFWKNIEASLHTD